MVGKYGHDDGVFHQVWRLERVEKIEVCVTARSGDPVLDELESGEPDGVERHVLRAPHALDRDRRETKIALGLACRVSKWAPMITISSLRSVPGISPRAVDARQLPFQTISFVDDEKAVQFESFNSRRKRDLSTFTGAGRERSVW